MSELLKIGASSGFRRSYPGGIFSNAEMVEYFHLLGLRGIDYDLSAAPSFGEDWKNIVIETANAAARHNICMNYGHLPFLSGSKGSNEDWDRLAGKLMVAIEVAGAAGIIHAVIHPVGLQSSTAEDNESDFKKNVLWLTPFVEHAKKHGVTLAVENMSGKREREGCHRYASCAAELIRIAEYFDIEVCWDFGHAHTTGLLQSDELRQLKGRLGVIHVNDNHGTATDEHLPPYLGTLDWVDAMKGLHEAEFSGIFNYEIRTAKVPLEARDEFGRYLLRVGEKLCGMCSKE